MNCRGLVVVDGMVAVVDRVGIVAGNGVFVVY